MTFLPIVERELRVAARRRFTFWSRLAAAGFALVIFALLQLLAQAARGAFPAGQVEFAVLKWMAFAYACAAGLFLTSDCLSEEKREGTLGLLFLTDLRGYDVVFGKFLSQSLRAFYALLAAFPIMGLALLSGGVTGGEFWRSVLVICNTLFFSLALGMLVSSVSRDSTKAMSGNLFLLILLVGGPPFVDSVLAGLRNGAFQPLFSVASPVWLFTATGANRQPEFWRSAGLQHILAWAFLAVASLRTPRAWQEKSAQANPSRPSLSHHWRFGGPRARAAMRRRWLEPNPVLWLAMRDRWLPRMLWALSLAVLLFQGSNLARELLDFHHGLPTRAITPFATLASSLQTLLGYGLTLWVAIQASRLFVDSARNGALEQLLVTPVTPGQIVSSQWTALWRTFLFPALCVAFLKLGFGILTTLQTRGYMAASTMTVGGKTTTTTSPGFAHFELFQAFNVLASAATFLAGLAAVGWFAMWMGLKSRKTTVAVLKTVCFVFILPWIAFIFAGIFSAILLIPALGMMGATWMMFVPTAVIGTLNLVKDLFFMLWSRRRLINHFREAIVQEERAIGSARRPSAGPLPPPVLPPSLPPVVVTS